MNFYTKGQGIESDIVWENCPCPIVYLYGALDELVESPPFHGGVCGFEARMRFHTKLKGENFMNHTLEHYENQINKLKARDEVVNKWIIRKLERRKRALKK